MDHLLNELFDVPARPHAVVVVAMRGSRVLLCQGPALAAAEAVRDGMGTIMARKIRASTPGMRTWCLPGGKLEERDRTPPAALFREFEEECGLDPHQVLRLPSQPFLKGYTHDHKTLWCYEGKIDPSVPESWDAPEGRCEFVELMAAPNLYRLDWLQTFCNLMTGLDSPTPEVRGYLLHLFTCEPCREHPSRLCPVGMGTFRAAMGEES